MKALRWVVRLEMSIWKSLFLLLAHRVSGSGTRFPYGSAVTPILAVFIVVGAVETVVFHVIIPWETVRLLCDVVSVWGLLWMIGYFASIRVHPHLVTPAGLRVRSGTSVDLFVPWSSVASVEVRRHNVDKDRRLIVEDGVASVPQTKETHVDVRLSSPVETPKGPVNEVRLHVDDPKSLVAFCRELLPV